MSTWSQVQSKVMNRHQFWVSWANWLVKEENTVAEIRYTMKGNSVLFLKELGNSVLVNGFPVPLFLLLSRFSCVRLCVTPKTTAHQAPPSLGFSRQEHWSGLPFPSPMYESEKWKWSLSVFDLATPWTAAYQAPLSMGFSTFLML